MGSILVIVDQTGSPKFSVSQIVRRD